MMGFVLYELLKCDVESLCGHGIYKAMERKVGEWALWNRLEKLVKYNFLCTSLKAQSLEILSFCPYWAK